MPETPERPAVMKPRDRILRVVDSIDDGYEIVRHGVLKVPSDDPSQAQLWKLHTEGTTLHADLSLPDANHGVQVSGYSYDVDDRIWEETVRFDITDGGVVAHFHDFDGDGASVALSMAGENRVIDEVSTALQEGERI